MRINPELLEVAPNNTRTGSSTTLNIDPSCWPDVLLCRQTIYKRIAIHDDWAVFAFGKYRIVIFNRGKP